MLVRSRASKAIGEQHRSGRAGWLRAAVLGADDGIVSISSLLIGVAASSAPEEAILIAGVFLNRDVVWNLAREAALGQARRCIAPAGQIVQSAHQASVVCRQVARFGPCLYSLLPFGDLLEHSL